jgi:hypothetical protein
MTEHDTSRNHDRCGTVREFTIECCHVCQVPKVPSHGHWWKCQNKHCEAYNQACASASYHKCFVPISDILAHLLPEGTSAGGDGA